MRIVRSMQQRALSGCPPSDAQSEDGINGLLSGQPRAPWRPQLTPHFLTKAKNTLLAGVAASYLLLMTARYCVETAKVLMAWERKKFRHLALEPGKLKVPRSGLEFVRSERGKPFLVYNNSMFRLEHWNDEVKNWGCIDSRKTRCRARIQTIGSQLIVKNSHHNHNDKLTLMHFNTTSVDSFFSPGLQFVNSQKGKQLLIYDNHLFYTERSYGSRKSWVCVDTKKFKCRARIQTEGSLIIVKNPYHTHTDHTQKLEERKFLDECNREEANMCDRIKHIYNGALNCESCGLWAFVSPKSVQHITSCVHLSAASIRQQERSNAAVHSGSRYNSCVPFQHTLSSLKVSMGLQEAHSVYEYCNTSQSKVKSLLGLNKNSVAARLEVWSSAEIKCWGKQEIPEKTRRPAASSGIIPTCKNPGVTRPAIERCFEFVYSKHGNPLLIHNQFLYYVECTIGLRKTWVCVDTKKFKCRGRVQTIGDKLVVKNAEHSHPHHTEKI
ncbi:hypothetical protein PR048_022852 [Dryococelus australis]|uniref:FLYWCH-type domain-containing protein n=1 Tax=Dryococelus australis TaxID=614101 RepID=A0ABQ9GSG7_9NEOP|nr:hypothetical protein PR048_022852 [Dryococelus australis]